jgi:hypothetical protein
MVAGRRFITRRSTEPDRTLVSVLAYSGPRPEEVVCRLAWDDVGERTIRYRDQKRRGQQHRVRFTPLLAPLAEDLREWFLASGRSGGKTPVFPAHDGGFWEQDDWRNWRGRVWHGEPERPRRESPLTDSNRRPLPYHPCRRRRGVYTKLLRERCNL